MMPRVRLNVLRIFTYVGKVSHQGVKRQRADTAYGYMKMRMSHTVHGQMHGVSSRRDPLGLSLQQFDTAAVAGAIHRDTAIQFIHVAGL